MRANYRQALWGAIALSLLVSTGLAETIPAPTDQVAQVIVSGRTTTLKRVEVAAVGQTIPATFSGNQVRNTKGFAWYVSRHYALKTDYDAAKARAWLELLEMAYPHYVALFGREPADIATRRMAVIYAKSRDSLAAAMGSDGIRWDFRGGGITYEGRQAAYQFPSGTLRYHRRYILLHECTHLFQMCLTGSVFNTPGWYHEGVADSLGSHVYDPALRRLTVHVFDRAPTVNMIDRGLAVMRKTPMTAAQIDAAGGASRGVNMLLVHFLSSTPDRMQRFRLFRDALIWQSKSRNRSPAGRRKLARVLGELYGGWPRLEADFKAWWTARRSTFHYVRWGWEQDASTLWSYGFAADGGLSQTDVNLPPGRAARYDPYRMDYPLEPVSPLVGPVARGVPDPTVGALVDFSPHPSKGEAGIALGVISGAPVAPFAKGTLFVDKNANVPGAGVIAYYLRAVRNKGKAAADLTLGRQIGAGVDPEITLGLARSPTAKLEADFVVEWKGYLRIDAEGAYQFALASDDGSWLWIDDTLVVDHGGHHPPTLKTGRAVLTKGLHRIRVRYFQTRGGRSLAAGFVRPGRPGCLKVLIERGRNLVIDGTDLGMPLRSHVMPSALRLAAHAGSHRYGLTATIGQSAVRVTVRARNPQADAPAAFTASAPISALQRKRLLERPGAVLARAGYHRITPYFDAARRPEGDLSAPANPDRWRNPGDRHLAAVYRAWYALGEHCPPELETLRKHMVAAAAGPPPPPPAARTHAHRTHPAIRAPHAPRPPPKPRKDKILTDLKSLAKSTP